MPKPELEAFFKKNIENLPQVAKNWMSMDHTLSLIGFDEPRATLTESLRGVREFTKRGNFLGAIHLINHTLKSLDNPVSAEGSAVARFFYEERASVQLTLLQTNPLNLRHPLSAAQKSLCTISAATDLMRTGVPSHWNLIANLFGQVGMREIEVKVMERALGRSGVVILGEEVLIEPGLAAISNEVMSSLSA